MTTTAVPQTLFHKTVDHNVPSTPAERTGIDAIADPLSRMQVRHRDVNCLGTAGGTGHAIEFTGSTVRELSMEGRMTLCNMAIEAGARVARGLAGAAIW